MKRRRAIETVEKVQEDAIVERDEIVDEKIDQVVTGDLLYQAPATVSLLAKKRIM